MLPWGSADFFDEHWVLPLPHTDIMREIRSDICTIFETVFYRVYCAYRSTTRRRWTNAKTLCFSRVVSVMRAGRTGIIDMLWVEAFQTISIA